MTIIVRRCGLKNISTWDLKPNNFDFLEIPYWVPFVHPIDGRMLEGYVAHHGSHGINICFISGLKDIAWSPRVMQKAAPGLPVFCWGRKNID